MLLNMRPVTLGKPSFFEFISNILFQFITVFADALRYDLALLASLLHQALLPS